MSYKLVKITIPLKRRRSSSPVCSSYTDDSPYTTRPPQRTKKLSEELERYRSQYYDHVVRPATELQDRLHAERPASKTLSFEPIAGWNTDKEREAVAHWRKSREKCPDTFQYLGLWKICLQFGECTPFDIIGNRHSLKAKRDPRKMASGFMLSDLMSTQLAKLVTHSLWPNSYPGALADNLAVAIQYVVILNTNDKRQTTVESGQAHM